MSLPNALFFNFWSYLKEKPKLHFETDWDKETFDWTNPETEKIRPKAFNQPPAFFRHLGRLRNQPVFDRFFVPAEGRFVVKLLESRLYPLCMDFIFHQCSLFPSSVGKSRYNWLRGLTEPPLKPIVQTLCRFFDEGNTVIVYNINKQTVHGVLVAVRYSTSDYMKDGETVDSVVNKGMHCRDRFDYVMQTLDLEKFLKIHLLLVDNKCPKEMEEAFTYGLMKGIDAWGRFCLPKSGVKCITVHPEKEDTIPLYKFAGFGVVKHNDKFLHENNVLQEVCYLIKVICYEDENWNNHKFHGIINY